ncbi:MAG TPA: ATPase, partial [Rhodobiaceae bacterium]|nr:ATPase [Rhodobiaceae bacterium]
MDIKTFGQLIDWTRDLHSHLASCLSHCATKHEEERARALLDYLA